MQGLGALMRKIMMERGRAARESPERMALAKAFWASRSSSLLPPVVLVPWDPKPSGIGISAEWERRYLPPSPEELRIARITVEEMREEGLL